MQNETCPECGAPLVGVSECRDYLNTMITWDFEDFAGVGQIHHLTVLSFNLQHPSVYSSKGLENAKASLKEFLLHPESFKEHDEWNRKNLASSSRDWKITGTSTDHGSYSKRPEWKILASDVVGPGLDTYVENVKNWSQSILETLRSSNNLI